ncbi:hypothetical protein AVEN_73465-1 [Araneus ventricosus]|uniref:C2H2-type domain-containing protein n=1 Tax=Araneus ventricosus TaxID=182803 RepID=A0A4Y2LTG1_ARAVE|nr:hypothetical protein AVEN_73465-1 [Araneus ventricosus]
MQKNKGNIKTKCFKCKKWFDFKKFIGHECRVLHSHPTSQPFVHINNCNKSKDDLQCYFCGLQMENPKLLEIHMRSCRHRNIPQICKLCRSPIRLRNHDQQYCANCSIAKDESQEYGLRFKATTQIEGLPSKSSRTVVPERNIENGDFATVNCTDAGSYLTYSRKRMTPMSDSRKQKEVKLKMKVAKHQIMEKQTQFLNLKIANATEVSTEQQIQVGVKQSHELHHPPDKLCKSSGKNTVQQKKDFKVASADVPFEKLKNNNSQKHNFKTSKRTDEKVRHASKKNDYLPGKSNSTHKVVTLTLLLNSIPENDCGMLLQSSSANKIDHFYKCCRCGKAFRNIKLGSMHYSNCKSTKFLSTVVDVSDIRWVCTICHSSFFDAQKLLNHLKGCNIFTKKYERACEKRCEKCHFRCISSLLFQKHDCTKELENMKTCSVRLNAVKINSVVDRVIMRECEFCGEIFDEQFTDQHFHSHHPGERSSGNFKQYYVNLHPGPSSDTVVVKTEPVSPVHEFVGNASCGFEGTEHYSHVNNHRSPNIMDNICMPPPPVNLPVLQSSVSLSNHQSPSAPTGKPSTSRHSASEGARLINQHICKCVNRNVGDDVKPCLKCLSKLDITKFAKNFKVVPFGLAKIKKETSEDSGALNSNAQADGSTAAYSAQIGKETELDQWRNERLASYLFTDLQSSLTPPSSHNGTSPPSTPTALVQSLSHVGPCSASDVSIGSLNDDISMISQLDEPNSSPVDLIDYITDDRSPVMPLMQCSDNRELFTPMESCEILHVSDVDSFNTVDVWAVVSSEGNTTIDKYICSECIHFSCLDQSSIIRHLCENHEKKLQYIAMYLVQPVSDSQ